MPDEPFAHLDPGLLKGVVESVALRGRKEREKEAIGELSLEHEVDAEEGSGEDVEDVSEQEGEGGKDVAGGGGECALNALGEGVDANLIGHGQFFESADDLCEVLREVCGELSEVAKDRWQSEKEEEGEREHYGYE